MQLRRVNKSFYQAVKSVVSLQEQTIFEKLTSIQIQLPALERAYRESQYNDSRFKTKEDAMAFDKSLRLFKKACLPTEDDIETIYNLKNLMGKHGTPLGAQVLGHLFLIYVSFGLPMN